MNINYLERNLFIIALVASIPCAANAANWVTVNPDSSGNRFQVDVDSSRVIDTSRIEIWTQTIYKKAAYSSAGIAYYKMINKVVFNCLEKTSQITYYVTYDLDGSVVTSGQLSDPPTPIIPNSNGDVIFNRICKGK